MTLAGRERKAWGWGLGGIILSLGGMEKGIDGEEC